jgi:DNA-binding NarL/FixJ family response regulator
MPRILIADDNESLRTALRKALSTREGWTICGEAGDGVSAVNLTEQLKPDLVILDFLMPLRNGLAAAAEIRKTLPELPIILYTMHMSGQLEREAHKVGVRRVVSKTETFQTFVESLEEFIGNHSHPVGPLGIEVGEGELKAAAVAVSSTEEIAAKVACDPLAQNPGEPPIS